MSDSLRVSARQVSTKSWQGQSELLRRYQKSRTRKTRALRTVLGKLIPLEYEMVSVRLAMAA